ncbi:asparaginase [Mycena filopes]|nr:asparaginase [Mycena filopes]
MAYIIVHGGAGVHSKNSEAEVKKTLRLACAQALNDAAAATNTPALSLVEHAIMSMEDSPLLNAGYGSNLTLEGTVECDAAVMDGLTGDFGSVAAVSGVKNPIRLAHRILQHARVPDPLARIPPLTLVSAGALAFARNSNYISANIDAIELVPPEALVAPRAERQWKIWKGRLDAGGARVGRGLRGAEGEASDDDEQADGLGALQDTVGAIAFSAASGDLASGVSSGGILLKHPGRVGEAAVFGSGCWARAARGGKMGVACSVSGAGEYIVRASLARTVCDAINDDPSDDVDVHEILERVLTEDFWKPSRGPSIPDPSAGIILLTTEDDDAARLWCAFTTPSMAIAYASSDNPQGKALILRRPKAADSRPNDQPRIVVTGFSI